MFVMHAAMEMESGVDSGADVTAPVVVYGSQQSPTTFPQAT